MKTFYYTNYGVFNTLEALLFYLTHFRSLGQKSKNNFVRFLVQIRTRKFAFEIIQSPLFQKFVENLSIFQLSVLHNILLVFSDLQIFFPIGSGRRRLENWPKMPKITQKTFFNRTILGIQYTCADRK